VGCFFLFAVNSFICVVQTSRQKCEVGKPIIKVMGTPMQGGGSHPSQ